MINIHNRECSLNTNAPTNPMLSSSSSSSIYYFDTDNFKDKKHALRTK